MLCLHRTSMTTWLWSLLGNFTAFLNYWTLRHQKVIPQKLFSVWACVQILHFPSHYPKGLLTCFLQWNGMITSVFYLVCSVSSFSHVVPFFTSLFFFDHYLSNTQPLICLRKSRNKIIKEITSIAQIDNSTLQIQKRIQRCPQIGVTVILIYLFFIETESKIKF